MTATTDRDAPSLSRTFQGITCVLAGMVLFVGQDLLMKDMLTYYPVWMLIFRLRNDRRSCLEISSSSSGNRSGSISTTVT